ncbi:MAG: hypothetical protein JSS14_09500 [Proteobacteria bacterium]|nr:hypothetical protein [Pseudomonadota bacterium]
MSRWFSLGLAAALAGTAVAPAHAAWLRDELRNFRTYPRLSEAYRLFQNKDYAEAREYVDQAQRIDPNNERVAILKFNICDELKDLACIRELGQDWDKRAPSRGLGPAMLTYLAFLDGRDAEVVLQAPKALRRSGLRPKIRTEIGEAWGNSLVRLGRTDEAAKAIAWMDSHQVAIADHNRKDWTEAIAHAAAKPGIAPAAPKVAAAPPAPAAPSASPTPAPTPTPAPAPAARVPAAPHAATASNSAHARRPAARAQRPATAPAPVARPAPPPAPLPTAQAEVLPLIESARYPEAVAAIGRLQQAGRLDAPTREGLVLTLQARDCPSVLQLVPPDASAPLTTARQQLAAAYCSGDDAALATRHFAAAQALAGSDTALASQALTGKAHSLALQGDAAGAQAALAEAVRLAPNDAQAHAAYGYQLKSAGEREDALREFETAWRLDASRTELLPELAQLARLLNRREDSIRFGRAAIDEQDSIQRRLSLPDDEAQRRLFGWRREVQTQEDRFNWSANANVRLDHGPDVNTPLSPVDYAQYGGSLNLGASYRYTPLDAQLPTWVFGRASVGLEDRSLQTDPENKLLGMGVRQRLLKDYMVVGSVEYLWRKSAEHEDDAMLRLSGSHTWGGDWNPVDSHWTYANVYADLAWLVRARTYYATLQGEWGRQFKLDNAPFKATFMPYLSSNYSANNDSIGRAEVDRLDVGVGVALLSWHWEDKYRAPAISQRLSLEVRHVVAGNSTDRQTVQLKWIMLH